MLTARQIDRLLPLLPGKNNNNFYRSRIPKCLFGTPEQADEIFEKETYLYRENFRSKWDYNVLEDKPVENPKNYVWDNLCNENKTSSSGNLVSVIERKNIGDEINEDNENRRNRRIELKRYSDENRSFSGLKKKRQILLPEIWHQKKSKSTFRKSS